MSWYYHTVLVRGHQWAAPRVVSCMYANLWTINIDTLTKYKIQKTRNASWSMKVRPRLLRAVSDALTALRQFITALQSSCWVLFTYYSANFWGFQTKQPSAITMPFFCKGNKGEETFCRVNNDVNIVLIFTALLIIFNCQQPASTLRGPIFIDQRYICHAATSTFFVSHLKFLYFKCNSYFLNRMFYISHSALQYLHLLHLTQYVHFLHLLYFQFKYCKCNLNILIVI